MEDAIQQLQTLKTDFEGTMDRIRKCKSIPAADLRGRYKKAYTELIEQGLEKANAVKVYMAFGGFAIADADVATFAKDFNAWAAGTDCERILRTASRAIRDGDVPKFYREMVKVRDVVRKYATKAGAKEDPLFRMTAEAIEQ